MLWKFSGPRSKYSRHFAKYFQNATNFNLHRKPYDMGTLSSFCRYKNRGSETWSHFAHILTRSRWDVQKLVMIYSFLVHPAFHVYKSTLYLMLHKFIMSSRTQWNITSETLVECPSSSELVVITPLLTTQVTFQHPCAHPGWHTNWPKKFRRLDLSWPCGPSSPENGFHAIALKIQESTDYIVYLSSFYEHLHSFA